MKLFGFALMCALTFSACDDKTTQPATAEPVEVAPEATESAVDESATERGALGPKPIKIDGDPAERFPHGKVIDTIPRYKQPAEVDLKRTE